MKLVLANNQTDRFVKFHKELQLEEKLYDYASYDGLLFYFEKGSSSFRHVDTEKYISAYSGVYINGYLNTPELANTTATVLDHNNVRYANSELRDAPSMSKISAYAKLAAHEVSLPRTYAGASRALRIGIKKGWLDVSSPIVLKRADADRGIDNYIFDNLDDVLDKLMQSEDRSIWLVQEFIPNDGFYLVSFYHHQPKFVIHRSLEERPDGKKELAHMYKPAGGANATLLNVNEVMPSLIKEATRSIDVLHREIASVDLVVDKNSNVPYVLEVNYNPQLVTIATFADIRQKAFLDAIKEL